MEEGSAYFVVKLTYNILYSLLDTELFHDDIVYLILNYFHDCWRMIGNEEVLPGGWSRRGPSFARLTRLPWVYLLLFQF